MVLVGAEMSVASLEELLVAVEAVAVANNPVP